MLLRLPAQQQSTPFEDAARLFTRREAEAESFYQVYGHESMPEDARCMQRKAFAGLLWSKQFYYYYDVDMWLDGDPAGPPPPERHQTGWTALVATLLEQTKGR